MDNRTTLLDQLRRDHSPAPPPATTRSRTSWIIGVLVLLIAIVVGAVGEYFLSAKRPMPVPTVVAQPEARPNTAPSVSPTLLEASGYVVAQRAATVSAKSIYKINEMLVQEGQSVKEGQVLARLDDTNARAALEQSKAQVKELAGALAAAQLAANDAQPTFVRSKAQLAEGLISAEAYEAANSRFDSLKSAASIAEQSLEVAQATERINQRYEDDTVIKAPFDGVVTVKTAQPGEIVSPQFSGGGGIAKIVDMNSLEVDVDVSESFINRVHEKQQVIVTLNAYPEWRIPARVIAVIPTADRAKATMKVRIGFDNKDPRIVPEMGARVSFLADVPTTG